MKQQSYTVRFVTPAFLGNAEQKGQWRTPPFKALLRQWWRVAYAADARFKVDVASMRREEGLLFGHVGLDDGRAESDSRIAAYKSRIRIRLGTTTGGGEAWTIGTQKGVKPLPDGLETSYAWFGLINRGADLPDRAGIGVGKVEAVRQLQLAFPDEYEKQMQRVITLAHAFGLLGSRSRGGWGALHIDGVAALEAKELQQYACDLAHCLEGDWAMALAKDDQGLCVWDSKIEFDDWSKAMAFIATRRKQVRTALKQGRDLRPALGFASPGRMPSPLRWKVMAQEKHKLTVRAFALPHRIPDDGGRRLSQQDLHSAWHAVSSSLDGIRDMQRLK